MYRKYNCLITVLKYSVRYWYCTSLDHFHFGNFLLSHHYNLMGGGGKLYFLLYYIYLTAVGTTDLDLIFDKRQTQKISLIVYHFIFPLSFNAYLICLYLLFFVSFIIHYDYMHSIYHFVCDEGKNASERYTSTELIGLFRFMP